MKVEAAGHVTVRPYSPLDETRTLELLSCALGAGPVGSRSPEFFRWKHFANPFGRSFMLVAESNGTLVGLRAFMAWRFRVGERTIKALRAVDTATHPEYQGRGIFSRLTLQALEAMDGKADLVFNTPNSASLPGYLKMGWRAAGRFPVFIRIRRPVAFSSAIGSLNAATGPSRKSPPVAADSAAEVLAEGDHITTLLNEADIDPDRISTPRDVEYLRWRYASATFLKYRAVVEQSGSDISGIAIFRVRSRGRLWESTVAELIVRRGDGQTARRLLRKIIRAARADHVTCRFTRLSDHLQSGLACGFVPSPAGITFVVKPLETDVEPNPASLKSWALSLGDLELF